MVKFGDVVKDVKESEKNPLDVGLDRYIGLEHIEPDNLHIKQWGDLNEDEVSFTKRFRKGQVLFGKRRAYQRKVAVAEFDGICSSDILTFEPKNNDLLPELLPFIVQSDSFFEHALDTSSGSLSPRTRWSQLKEFEFSLPPKDEQRRIAKLLVAATKTVNANGTALDKLILLREVKAAHAIKEIPAKTVQLGYLVKNDELDIQTGPFGTVLSASSYVDSGTPIFNPIHMQDGILDTESGPFVSDSDVTRLSRFQMRPGDILLSRKGEMGRIVLIDQRYEGMLVGSDCMRLRFSSEHIDPAYVVRFLRTPQLQSWLHRFASGTTMPGINERTLHLLEIRIPTLEIQEKMNSLFDGFEHVIKKQTQQLAASKNLLKCLRNQFVSLGSD